MAFDISIAGTNIISINMKEGEILSLEVEMHFLEIVFSQVRIP